MVYVYDVTRRVVFDEVHEDVVLLSPSLYWYKSCAIPTKSLAKAKSIARHMMSERPSRFGEVILYKRDGHYDAYAYDKGFVRSLLKELDLRDPQVYFANQLQLSEAVAIDDEYVLYEFGGRVMQGRGLQKGGPEQVGGFESGGELVGGSRLVDSYRELLRGQDPIGDFLKSDRNVTKMLLGVAVLLALYVGLFSVDKIVTLNSIDESASKLEGSSSVSFYEMQSLIKRYAAQEKRATKLKSELEKALKRTGVESLIYEDGRVEIEDAK